MVNIIKQGKIDGVCMPNSVKHVIEINYALWKMLKMQVFSFMEIYLIIHWWKMINTKYLRVNLFYINFENTIDPWTTPVWIVWVHTIQIHGFFFQYSSVKVFSLPHDLPNNILFLSLFYSKNIVHRTYDIKLGVICLYISYQLIVG